MKDLMLKAGTVVSGKTISLESLRHWQRRVGSYLGNPQLPETREERVALLLGLQAALRPAGAEYVAKALMKLQVLYWRPDFSPAEAKAFYAIHIEDLSDVPPDILDDAIREYRTDPDSRFFPHPGAIRGRARPKLAERRCAIDRLKYALEEAPPIKWKPRTTEEIARIKAAAKTLFHVPPEEVVPE